MAELASRVVDAVRVGGKHAAAYAFWSEPLDGIRQRIAEVRAAASEWGRDPRLSVSLRRIVAHTEEEAWARAEDILSRAQARFGSTGAPVRSFGKDAEGSRRLVEAAEKADVHDTRLWTRCCTSIAGGLRSAT